MMKGDCTSYNSIETGRVYAIAFDCLEVLVASMKKPLLMLLLTVAAMKSFAQADDLALVEFAVTNPRIAHAIESHEASSHLPSTQLNRSSNYGDCQDVIKKYRQDPVQQFWQVRFIHSGSCKRCSSNANAMGHGYSLSTYRITQMFGEMIETITDDAFLSPNALLHNLALLYESLSSLGL